MHFTYTLVAMMVASTILVSATSLELLQKYKTGIERREALALTLMIDSDVTFKKRDGTCKLKHKCIISGTCVDLIHCKCNKYKCEDK